LRVVPIKKARTLKIRLAIAVVLHPRGSSGKFLEVVAGASLRSRRISNIEQGVTKDE
jgi:hypothetical protein